MLIAANRLLRLERGQPSKPERVSQLATVDRASPRREAISSPVSRTRGAIAQPSRPRTVPIQSSLSEDATSGSQARPFRPTATATATCGLFAR